MVRRLLLSSLVVASFVGGTTTVHAQKDEALARDFYRVARQAANQNRFDDAIRALELAYEHSENPKMLVNIARTAQRKHRRDGDRESLEKGVKACQRYLDLAPADQKRLRKEARTIFAELEPKLAKILAEEEAAKAATVVPVPPIGDGPDAGEGGAGEDPPPVEPPPPAPVTPPAPPPPSVPEAEVMASSSTPDAFIELDGDLGSVSPLIAKVAPGKHRLTISADGYFTLERELDLKDGQTLPLDLALKPKPARITVEGTAGAELWIDGERRGRLPLAAPLALTPGNHFLAVTETGRTPFSQSLFLQRDGEATVTAHLDTTGQRYAAWVTLGAGAAGVLAGGILTGLAVVKENEAEDIASRKDTDSIQIGEVGDYDAARADRNAFRAGAITSFAIGATALGVGTAMFLFDDTTVTAPLRQDEPGEGESDEIQVTVTPAVGPRLWGGSVHLRF